MSLLKKIATSLHILPTLRLVWQAAPGWMTVQILILCCQGILPIILLYLTKLIIDTLTAKPSANLRQLGILLGLTAIVALVTTICKHWGEVVQTAQGQRVTDYMQDILHAKSIAVDLEYYENPEYHNTLQRAQQEAPYRPNQIVNRLLQVLQQSISLLAMMGLLFSLHWVIAGVLLFAAFPALIVRIKYAGVMYRWQRQRTSVERQNDYLNWLLTVDIFAKEMRLFDLGNLFAQRSRRLRQRLYKEQLAISTKRSLANLSAQILAGILICAVYGFIIYRTVQGQLQLGDLVLYHQAFQRGQNALQGLLTALSGLYEDNLFLSNLYEFLHLQPKVVEPASPQPIPQPLRQGIAFEQVSFQYAHSTRKALQDISLKIAPGEVIALVGENGSGKTTLIKLLCRLYDPSAGRITIDGIDIREFAIADLRRQLSVIFQDYVKYHLTAQENIWLGNIELPENFASISQAAHRSGAHQVIQSLPQGYDTMLGKWFADGEELSIGQWQKIALARAFLRTAQVIVLDEPTSAMDPKAEYEVFQQFRQLIHNQAAILITHRLSTVKMADCIYVLHQGSLVESGTHHELMHLGGMYAKMFTTQAQNYLM